MESDKLLAIWPTTCTHRRVFGNVRARFGGRHMHGNLEVSHDWVVLKFGGTSVSGRSQWDTIAGLLALRRSEGFRVALVCSAVSGITNELQALSENPALTHCRQTILDRHIELGQALGVDEAEWLPEATQKLDAACAALGSATDHGAQTELIALGEWLSTRLGALFLGQSMPVSWVDAREALAAVDEPGLSPARQWFSASCVPGEDQALQADWDGKSSVVITQGFIAGKTGGGTALLGRGGSDTSAALLGGRLAAARVEIWTDVPGLFSADPRQVPQARLLRSLEYSEALEMAASGARVIHAGCLRTAAVTRTPVVIRDTGRPHLQGTLIGATHDGYRGVKSICCQQDMAVLLLQKHDSRREVGFLAGVFDTFQQFGISIDLVATSETTTTVAINMAGNHLSSDALERLVQALEQVCAVDVFHDCVCINLVGRPVRTALARLQTALGFFDEHPLLMLSQSANDLCLSLLVRREDHEELLQHLHAGLIPINDTGASAGPDAAHAAVFGPEWTQL